jgi:Tfp pilus assembly protein PilN
LKSPRLAVVLLGERLVVASVQGTRVETFAVDAEQPATALRAELNQRGLAARTVALGLPRAAVTVKPIDLPQVNGELREMVRFELERHLPFPSDDAAFDFVALPTESPAPTGPTSTRRVLITAADRRVVEGALRLADEARLRPLSLTVAAHDLLGLVASRQRGQVVWVHRVGENAALLFLADGHLVLSRSVPTADDATIASEIRRSYGVTRWRDADAIWVSGDGDAPEVAPALTTLGAPVTAPPFTARARALLDSITDPQRGAAELAVAVAAGPRVRPLDLLPVPLRPRRLTRQQLTTIGVLAAAVFLGVIALLVPGYRESRRLATINQRVAALDREVRGVEQTLQELERRRRLLATIQSIESSTVRPLPVLRELTELLPNNTWLSTVSIDGKGIELTGQAAASSDLIPILENSPRFERVEFASPVTRGRDKEQFRIRASWEPTPGTAVAAAKPAPARSPQPPRP